MANITSPNRRFIIAKNLIIMLVVLVVGLLAVWSWFTVNQQVQANNIKVTAAYPNKIGLAKVIKYYDNTNSNEYTEGPDAFQSQLSFQPEKDFEFTKDCTGDAKTLIVPDFSVTKDKDDATRNGRIVNLNGEWEEALSNTEVEKIKAKAADTAVEARYIECEFYVRSKTKSMVLSSSSYLKSETEMNGNNLFTELDDNDPKKSAYGRFNVDALVGAMRVGLVAQGASNVSQALDNTGNISIVAGVPQTSATLTTEEAALVWVPRPDVKLNTTSNTDDWEITRVTQGDTFKHTYFEPEAPNSATSDYFDTQVICSNNTVTPNDTNNYKKIYSRLFIKPGNTLNLDNDIIKKKGRGVKSVECNNGQGKVLVSQVGENGLPYIAQEKNLTDSLSFTDSLTACSLPKAENINETDNYYVFKFKLRIWIEGSDSEARRAMDGGKFALHLEFR
jgi:hypothetical protein